MLKTPGRCASAARESLAFSRGAGARARVHESGRRDTLPAPSAACGAGVKGATGRRATVAAAAARLLMLLLALGLVAAAVTRAATPSGPPLPTGIVALGPGGTPAPDDVLAHTTLSRIYQAAGMIAEAEAEGGKARILDWKRQLKEGE